MRDVARGIAILALKMVYGSELREDYLISKRISLMTAGSPCGMSANRALIVLVAGPCESLFDPGLDVAFRLPTNCGQLGNDKISSALEHALLAK